MTFKELANELMEQGWRCYHISDVSSLTRGSSLHSWAVRNAVEVRVYEDKSLVFIKDTKPLVDAE